MSPRPFLETGNGIIEIGNGIILPTYRLLIKKILLQKFFLFNPKSQFTVDQCEQEHASDVVLEVDGKKGFISQRRGAVVNIIKCKPTDVSYRNIDEDTEEIPVYHNGRQMYVDPITFVLKPNATLIPSGTYLPIKWKIGYT